jgi:hypothetical protein
MPTGTPFVLSKIIKFGLIVVIKLTNRELLFLVQFPGLEHFILIKKDGIVWLLSISYKLKHFIILFWFVICSPLNCSLSCFKTHIHDGAKVFQAQYQLD